MDALVEASISSSSLGSTTVESKEEQYCTLADDVWYGAVHVHYRSRVIVGYYCSDDIVQYCKGCRTRELLDRSCECTTSDRAEVDVMTRVWRRRVASQRTRIGAEDDTCAASTPDSSTLIISRLGR